MCRSKELTPYIIRGKCTLEGILADVVIMSSFKHIRTHTNIHTHIYTHTHTHTPLYVYSISFQSCALTAPHLIPSNLLCLAHVRTKLINFVHQVKQSWITTVFTTLRALVQAVWLVAEVRPDLILCNGPGK